MTPRLALLLATVSTAFWPAVASATTIGVDPNTLFTLSNGSGDGDISARLTAYGVTREVYYDPVGTIGGSDPVYYSTTYLAQAGAGLIDLGYSSALSSATIISQSANQLVSSFSTGSLSFTLTQTVQATLEGENRSGSILTQTFAITNTADTESTLSMVRYFDGDLRFNDGTLADGGGVLEQGGQLVLFETDATGSETDAQTFIGITAAGGDAAGYAVQNCCGVNIYPLPNTVDFDTNDDGFADTAYDVTLQLQRDFSIGAGATEYFSTSTLFGNGVPPAPGSIESLPLVDDSPEPNEDDVLVYSFDIPASYEPEVTIWIDPVVAVGYTYTVTGSTFHSVTAPSYLAVPDADGYELWINDTFVRLLASGDTAEFLDTDMITSFEIRGIDPDVGGTGLDPENATAFVTGISLYALTGTTVVTMAPITRDYNPDPVVPLPASIWLLMTGMGGLAALRRRKI